jgi:hypothetical protein
VLLFANLGWTALLIVLVLVAAAWFALTYLRERATANGSAPG